MKKLNKIPSKEIIRYDAPTGYDFNYGFVFSEELPYKTRKNMARYMRDYRRKEK